MEPWSVPPNWTARQVTRESMIVHACLMSLAANIPADKATYVLSEALLEEWTRVGDMVPEWLVAGITERLGLPVSVDKDAVEPFRRALIHHMLPKIAARGPRTANGETLFMIQYDHVTNDATSEQTGEWAFMKCRESDLSTYKSLQEPPKPAEERHGPPLKPGVRFDILKRDNYRCRLCGVAARDADDVRLHVDHITARGNGGTDDPANLWTLCSKCNSGKWKKDL
jgi:hypothetical protein